MDQVTVGHATVDLPTGDLIDLVAVGQLTVNLPAIGLIRSGNSRSSSRGTNVSAQHGSWVRCCPPLVMVSLM